MGIHNIIIQQVREEIWLEHQALHIGSANWPNELCIFCEQEVESIKADHIQGEVDEQVRGEWAEMVTPQQADGEVEE
jgi:uncharacterized protein with PIN domain